MLLPYNERTNSILELYLKHPDFPDDKELESSFLNALENASNYDLLSTIQLVDIFAEQEKYKIESHEKWGFVVRLLEYFTEHEDSWNVIFIEENEFILYTDIYITIESVTDFLSIVIAEDDENEDSDLVFRGQANVVWDMIPSIFRDNNILSENDYYNKIRLREPFEFSESQILDNIVKMQHYGLPTRLLDVTYNPLVSLFFACSEYPKNCGIVYLFNEYMSSAYESDAVNILAHSVLVSNEWKDRNDYINGLKSVCEIITSLDNKEVEAIIEKNYFINANNHNERIRRQQGAFIMFGMDFSRYGTPYKSIEDKIVKRLMIPNVLKPKILKELDLVGINEGFIYPELEHQAKYIKSKFKTNRIYSSTADSNKDENKKNDEEQTLEEKQNYYQEVIKATIISLGKKYKFSSSKIIKSKELIEIFSELDWFTKSTALGRITNIFKNYIKDNISDEATYKTVVSEFRDIINKIEVA